MAYAIHKAIRGVAIGMLIVSSSMAQSTYPVRHRYHCGAIHACAITRLRTGDHTLEYSYVQRIWIYTDDVRREISLDLMQQKSWQRAGRHAWLDGVAYQWRCLHGRGGTWFLALDFDRQNESARSCAFALDAPRDEWTQIYDEKGHPLFRDPLHGQDLNDEKSARALGLWDQMDERGDTVNPRNTYF